MESYKNAGKSFAKKQPEPEQKKEASFGNLLNKLNKKSEAYAPVRKRKVRRRKLNRTDKLILGIPTAVAIIAVSVALLVRDYGNSYEFEAAAHQYYGGSAASIEAGTKLKLTENDKAQVVNTSGSTSDETTLPVYMDKERTVVLTTNMLYYMPRSGSYTRVSSLSEVNCQENGVITISKGKDSVKPESGFLYDGNDFFIFLEAVRVQFKGYTVELPALSYAEVVNGGDIMLFNYETKEFVMERIEGTVLAYAGEDDYIVSLLGDSVTNYAGETTLLISRPEEVDPIL